MAQRHTPVVSLSFLLASFSWVGLAHSWTLPPVVRLFCIFGRTFLFGWSTQLCSAILWPAITNFVGRQPGMGGGAVYVLLCLIRLHAHLNLGRCIIHVRGVRFYLSLHHGDRCMACVIICAAFTGS